ncbi:sigma 54 modulation/S30EA ribosomal C-terminal domain-containing protein [Nocardia blacklockiae]|uniref:sigma 54 modulation/S30EA ribosomal C-terminal domain-containing protein n=1 Tax=Nocardia blacklockiae TaxID=480036 RepID=UPI001896060E|nr:sigma 54 modulation/S30EA ribosomal C-terminal domain-containing protein [Nocardia blacklockiae]MBF6175616.1 sigma 54 modulation/S30EA ribosomal C-terminal domain-containing protein [Nocardia blacklockiae]
MRRTSATWWSEEFPDVVVLVRGQVPRLEGERLAGAVGRLLARSHLGGGARIRVSGANCDTGPMLVQVNLTVADRPVRMQTMTRGRGDIMPAVVRLERQLETAAGSTRRPWPDPSRPPLAVPVPGDLARRKAFALRTTDPSAAVAAMDALDYDAHLFTHAGTGADAVVYRAGPTGLRLAHQYRTRSPRTVGGPGAAPVYSVDPHPAPALTADQAVDHLCSYGMPFLFFTDPASDRGHLLYRRYDADLGLITPAHGGETPTRRSESAAPGRHRAVSDDRGTINP